MADLYSINEGGGEWFNLADVYDTALEAETAAAAVGHPGVAVLRSVYLAEPATIAAILQSAKAEKLLELTTEGNRRTAIVSPLFESVLAALALGAAVKAASLEMLGADYVAVGVAYGAAVAVIIALPNKAAVDAYNVVTGPAWP